MNDTVTTLGHGPDQQVIWFPTPVPAGPDTNVTSRAPAVGRSLSVPRTPGFGHRIAVITTRSPAFVRLGQHGLHKAHSARGVGVVGQCRSERLRHGVGQVAVSFAVGESVAVQVTVAEKVFVCVGVSVGDVRPLERVNRGVQVWYG
jgi:hypothetical protein